MFFLVNTEQWNSSWVGLCMWLAQNLSVMSDCFRTAFVPFPCTRIRNPAGISHLSFFPTPPLKCITEIPLPHPLIKEGAQRGLKCSLSGIKGCGFYGPIHCPDSNSIVIWRRIYFYLQYSLWEWSILIMSPLEQTPSLSDIGQGWHKSLVKHRYGGTLSIIIFQWEI